MFEGYNASTQGEKDRKFRLLGVRFAMILGLGVISLITVGILKWQSSSLHASLAKRHEQTTAHLDVPYKSGEGADISYSIGYSFTVNGRSYHNYAESKINPTYPRGIVFYNPDDPNENELQPIPKEEEYHGPDRFGQE